jgi:hypothetical protein
VSLERAEAFESLGFLIRQKIGESFESNVDLMDEG